MSKANVKQNEVKIEDVDNIIKENLGEGSPEEPATAKLGIFGRAKKKVDDFRASEKGQKTEKIVKGVCIVVGTAAVALLSFALGAASAGGSDSNDDDNNNSADADSESNGPDPVYSYELEELEAIEAAEEADEAGTDIPED